MEWPWEYPRGFQILLLGQLLVGVAFSAWILLRRGPVGIARGALGLSCIGAVAGACALWSLFRQGSFFAVLSHAFVALLAIGVCALLLLLLARGRSTSALRGLAWAGAAGLPVLGWAALVEPYDLERMEVEVPVHVLREGSAPLRIGVLSDLQSTRVRSHEHAAVDLLLEARPDVILLPGDIYQGPVEDWPRVREGFRELLQRLVALAGAYLVPGDCDSQARLREVIQGTPVRLLLGTSEPLRIRDRAVLLHGVELHAPDRQALAAFARGDGNASGPLRILLAHRPEVAFEVPLDTPLDLVVAGHTHGGQVRLPGGLAIVDLSPVPNRVGGGGLHYLGHQLLYVSRGVGMERRLAPRLRLGCRPEVSLLVLE